ncbi:hypothetical protein [Curtobacterium sp. SORGH_AS_0776]|uniref:hypothetical protein n=1 Tax=Curtobacterium sp. SORGH_AS_0776 TaxID=3041798 RepID=UPI00286BA9E3|nr:hypothetical protein [Curtobacterium sp. SORGH_AS_0776]
MNAKESSDAKPAYTEWAVRHSQGTVAYTSERSARENLEWHMSSYEKNARNNFKPYIVTREVTDWVPYNG